MLKPFHAEYYDHWPYGGYDERDYLVWANTEQEALGLILESQNDTQGKHWTLTELSPDKEQITFLAASGT